MTDTVEDLELEIIRLRAELAAEREAHELTRQQSADLLTQYCNERDAARAALAAERERFEEEHAIVDRIWKQLGFPTYEQLNGRSIYDLIDELKSGNAKLREALVRARNYLYFQPTKNDCMLAAIDAVLAETGGEP